LQVAQGIDLKIIFWRESASAPDWRRAAHRILTAWFCKKTNGGHHGQYADEGFVLALQPDYGVFRKAVSAS
jgi:hypothetical protein